VKLNESLPDLGKPQDGIVSRFLNRPISHAITRWLLKFPITPNAWTLSIFPLLVVAFLFLWRGDYLGFVIGTALFQIYSILDGCDGEIARAKHLESKRGRQLDTLCDVLGNLLLVVGLGYGLRAYYGSVPQSSFYPWEGILCGLMIAINELLLHSAEMDHAPADNSVASALYPRQRGLVQHSGLLLLGEKVVWWLVQLTKRDVAILFFFLLAIVGLPQWILHFSIIVAAASLALALRARSRGSSAELRG
jgi:hypothetical protein